MARGEGAARGSTPGNWSTLFVCAVLSACARDAREPTGPELSVRVAPFTLPGVSDACYRLTVYNTLDPAAFGPDTEVWTQPGLCASAHGGAGGIRFTGPCDATAPGPTHDNAVRLELEGLYVGGPRDQGGSALTAGLDYANPCPATPSDNGCVLPAACVANLDNRVEFSLTIVRDAKLGFFDTAVRLDEVFCAAKLDCLDEESETLLYLPDGDADGPTAVLGFACTGGPGSAPPYLYLDDLVVSCRDAAGNLTRTATVDPSAGPGHVPPKQATHPKVLFGAAVHRGLGFHDTLFWNVLLGLRLPGLAGETCTLTTHGTATRAALNGGETPDSARYPFIRWDLPLIAGNAAAPACARHPLNGTPTGVATSYTPLTAPRAFTYELHGDTIRRLGGFPAALGITEHSPNLGARHIIDGLFTGYPDPTHEWAGAVPRSGPDAERFYFDYDGQWLAGILEGFTCPEALDDEDGVTLAIATEGGAVGWLLRATPQGLTSALRNGVDVTDQGLAQARIAFATSPHAPDTPHYLIEFEVSAAPGGFSYRVVGADLACALPSSLTFIYGDCPPEGGIRPAEPWAPATGTPLSPTPAGGVVRVPGDFALGGATFTLDGVPLGPRHVQPDHALVGVPSLPPGTYELLVCHGDACLRHELVIYDPGATPRVIGQPAVYAPPHTAPFGGGGTVSFLWSGQPVLGQRSFFCGCGHHDGMPCMMMSWHGGAFGPDADKLIVYGGTPDGERLAIVGHSAGHVEAWLDGVALPQVVGRVTEGASPWSGGPAIQLEVCLPLPWTEYVLGLTGPCPGGYCDEPQAIDVRSWNAGRYTEQAPTSAPRIVVVGPGSEPLAGATAQGPLGLTGADPFVVRGTNLGPAAGTALFQGAVAGPAGLTWSESVVTGTLPAQAVTGPLVLSGAKGVTNAVDVEIGVPPPPTPSCVYVRDVLGGTTTGIYSYDPDGPGPEPAFPIYCDQEADGGGWVLIAYWVSGTDSNRAWNDVAVVGRAMKPYTAAPATYPVPPIGVVNTFGQQRFATTIPWFAASYGAWVRYPMFADPMVPMTQLAATSAHGSAVTLNPAEPFWGLSTTGAQAWSLWTGACGGLNNCGAQACPSAQPYTGYPCHLDYWHPKLLFAR